MLPPPAAPAAVCARAAAGACLPQPLALPQTLPGGLHRSVHTMGRYSAPYHCNVLSRGEAAPELGLAGGRGEVGGQPQSQLPHPAPHPGQGHPARPARGRRPRGDGQSVHYIIRTCGLCSSSQVKFLENQAKMVNSRTFTNFEREEKYEQETSCVSL